MRYRTFGRTQLSVSELTLGAMRLTGDAAHVPVGLRPSSEDISRANEAGRRTLFAAIDAGVNCFHSSEDYGTWWMMESALRHHPKRGELHHVIKVSTPDYHEANFDPQHVRTSVENALRALHSDRITFVQHLQRGPRVTPAEAYSQEGDARRIALLATSAEAFAEVIEDLRQEGKVGVGLSFPHTVGYAKAAIETGHYSGVCHFLNLIETEIMPLFDDLTATGMGFFAIRPLLQGMLTDKRVDRALLSEDDPMRLPIWDSRYRVLDEVRRQVEPSGESWSAHALRFALAHPAVTSVVTSARSEKQLLELLSVCDGVYPESSTIRAIRKASSAADGFSKFDLFPENQVV